MLPSTVAVTERSWIWRCWATAATPAVRQLASADSTYSTGVAPRSSEAKHSGWSASNVNVRAMLVLLAEAGEPVDGRAAVRAVHPLAGRPPRELGGLRRVAERLAGAEQCLGVDAVVDGGVGDGHGVFLSCALLVWLLLVMVVQGRAESGRRAERDDELAGHAVAGAVGEVGDRGEVLGVGAGRRVSSSKRE